MFKLTAQSPTDIPANWERLTVRKMTPVTIRASNGVESFKVSWQEAVLTSDPEVDLIVIQPNGKEYPCKKDIFFETYVGVPALETNEIVAGYKFIKKATTTLVRIPQGVDVEIITLEGTLPSVSFPDFIAIGPKGELYANTLQFVNDNLQIVTA